MKTSTTFAEPMLSSLLFCSALGAWVLSGCSAKIDGYVPMGGDTGGTTATGGFGGDTGGATATGGFGGDTGGTTATGGVSATTSSTTIDQTAVTPDPTVLSTGTTNQVSTGGYWWTYTDHNPDGSQYHATITPTTNRVTPLMPSTDIDPNHGHVLRIVGEVPGQLHWVSVAAQDPQTIDTYWQSSYPDSMIPDYPAAGIGFGFLPANAPFDATGGGQWVGIAFDMKTMVDTPVVWVSMPTVYTDLPDPNMQDALPKQCLYFTASNTPSDGAQTCFAHYRMGIYASYLGEGSAFNTLVPVGEWKRYCVLYSQVAIPDWANAPTIEALRAHPFDPSQLLKVQWDMYQPMDGEDPSLFDVSLDNVNLLSAAQAADAANNCDPAWIGAPPGTGNAG